MNCICFHQMNYRYNICSDDVFRGINDTTNSALLAGLNISQGRCPNVRGTTCQMHAQELVVKHALGLHHRSKNKVAYDENVEGKQLRDRVKTFVSTLMNKKKKNLFIKYKKYAETELQSEALRLEIPNDTRVSGVFRMYESVLRAKRSLVMFCTKSEEYSPLFKDLLLTTKEWQDVAETHAILKIVNVVAMTSQQESVDSNCISFYQIQSAIYSLTCKEKFNVININDTWKPNTEIEKIPTNTLSKTQLSANSIALIENFQREFSLYFKEPDSDQQMMMVFHPIMVYGGLQ